MAKDEADKLKQKKQELEAELKNIQHELDDSIDRVRSDVNARLDPAEFIKKHPLPMVGVSVLIGYLAGNKKSHGSNNSSVDGFSATLWYELKKLATKKAISLTSEYLENIFMDRAEKHSSSQNGSVKKD